jgi:methionyl-tRNA synthetase
MTARFYVTTPIYYVNSAPHIGTAYTTVVADALARFHALRGARTHFLTGTDEHGLKIEREATRRGVSAQAFTDEMSQRFRDLCPKLGCRPDDFIRTTDARHEARVQAWWKRCAESGDIYLGTYTGLYCVSCEEHKTEKELLPGNLCAVHNRPAEEITTESYFFRLSRYADRLLELYKRRPEFVRPETRLNEVVSFVKEGLRDLSVSRTEFSWGIPVPGDAKHVMYVWFDALFNYMTAVEEADLKAAFWPPDVQLVGKDILRFHAVYWPAFLMSAGLTDDELPRTVWSHGWLLTDGQKVSKSRSPEEHKGPQPRRLSAGTTDPVRLADALGPDVVRFFLLKEVSLGQDAEYSVAAIINTARTALAETVGNLLNRALPFVKHFDGAVPHAPPESLTDTDRALRQRAREVAEESARAWESMAPHRALELTIDLARAGNKYFDENAPWKLVKSGDTARLAVVIAHVFELLRALSVLLWPAIPSKSDAIRAQLGLDPIVTRTDADLWPFAWGGLAAHTKVAPGSPVFPKYDAAMEAQLFRELDVREVGGDGAEKPRAEKKPVEKKTEEKPAAPEAAVPPITYDELMAKVELRVGKVLTAERIPRKDRLLKLSVDLGEPSGPRVIIAGIALAYAPEQLAGKQVIVVANLPPRDFGGGLVSHGMLLAASSPDSLSVATFEKDYAPGTRVK